MVTGFRSFKYSGWVYSVAFSPDGRSIAAGGRGGTVKMWDLNSGDGQSPRPFKNDGGIDAVAFSPDGRSIAADGGKTLKIWDLNSGGSQDPQLFEYDDWIDAIAFSPDGRSIAAGGKGGVAVSRRSYSQEELKNLKRYLEESARPVGPGDNGSGGPTAEERFKLPFAATPRQGPASP